MHGEILRRLAIAIPQLLIMTFLTFLLIDLAPGDILAQYRFDPRVSQKTIHALEEKYHFDKPVIIQYGYWLVNFCKGDLGYSFSRNAQVTDVILERVGNTFLLGIFALLCTWLIAIPLGVYAAVRQYSWSDRIMSIISYFGMSLPSFFLALLLMYLIYMASGLPLIGSLPISGMVSPGFSQFTWYRQILDVGAHLILPTVVLTIGALASLQRIARGNMLEELRKNYITTARAKGLSEQKVIYGHALRNAINPLITLFGFSFSDLLSGAALLEIIINWPGLGSCMLAAVRSQDTFLVMGSMLMGGAMLVVGNLLADILLIISDPRVRR
jgi:peptide/nickel transport system permease protein